MNYHNNKNVLRVGYILGFVTLFELLTVFVRLCFPQYATTFNSNATGSVDTLYGYLRLSAIIDLMYAISIIVFVKKMFENNKKSELLLTGSELINGEQNLVKLIALKNLDVKMWKQYCTLLVNAICVACLHISIFDLMGIYDYLHDYAILVNMPQYFAVKVFFVTALSIDFF